LGLRQALYQPRLTAALTQARLAGQGAKADYVDQEQALADRYLGGYLNLLLTEEQLTLVSRQRESVAVQLDATQKAFVAGSGTRTDIIETQAQFDRLMASELQARQAVELARFEMQTLLGKPVQAVQPLSISVFSPESLSPGQLSEWLLRLERQSPRLISRKARLEASEVAAGAAKLEGYPTLDLVVQTSRSSSDDAYNVNAATRQNAVGIMFSLPIYTGGAVSSRVRQTAFDLITAQEQLEQARKQLELQLRQQYFAVKEGIEMIGALVLAKASADQALSANVQSFRAGARRSLDVLAAEQRQLQAALDLSKARYQALLAWVRLHGLVGGADERLMRQLDQWFVL
jgi:TolC family type I secretion outer membrane protein